MEDHYPVVSIAIGAFCAYGVATIAGAFLARGGFPIPSGNKRIGYVGGLRGYLALSVLVHHFIIWMQVTRLGGGWSPPTVNVFNNLGAGSVALFFMTTGLVFYPRVLAGFHKTSWLATYTGRVFRIIPLIVVSVSIITVIVALRTGARPDSSFPRAAAQWIMAWREAPLLGYPDSGRLNAYVLWSLWYEWLFYLFVLPACALAMDGIRGRLPGWALPVALLPMAVVNRRFHAMGGLEIYLPLFAVGMLAFECQRNRVIRDVLASRWMTLPALLCLAIGMARNSTPYGSLQLPLFGFFFIAVACGNDLAGALRTKASLLLGECSYGIYLLHGTVLSLLFVDCAPALRSVPTRLVPMLLPLAALSVACITSVIYLVIERPGIRAGQSIASRLTGRQRRIDDPQLEVAP